MFAVASGCLFVLNVRRFFVSKRRSFLFLIIFRLRFCRHRKREKKVHAKSTWIYNEAIHTHANRLTLLIEAKNKPLYMRATTKFLRCCQPTVQMTEKHPKKMKTKIIIVAHQIGTHTIIFIHM